MHATKRAGAVAVLISLAAIVSLLLSSSVASTPNVEAVTTQANLTAPTDMFVLQDDANAILYWDKAALESNSDLPAGVMGYRVTWGPVDNPTKYQKLTAHRLLQLQPLENGKPYVAWVQAVDAVGRLGPASQQVAFTGDPSRVERLRSQMNGFFDDFNLPQGLPDERKWNVAYSLCNGSEGNGFFVNDQYHVHNTVFSKSCDRSQNANRARALLDFSDNGTRTIVFDFDGVHHRNFWYLDLVPIKVDVLNPELLPPGGIRLKQLGQMVAIQFVEPNGEQRTIVETNWQPFRSLEWAGLKLVPNVRRQWVVRMTKEYMEVLIDGKLVLATPTKGFQLRQNQYHVIWTTFSYNTPKANQPFVLAHWDNFGFDAPTGSQQQTVTHNYRRQTGGSDLVMVDRGTTGPGYAQVAIPDSVAGSVARRLMFTLQMPDTSAYQWSANDKVVVNGQAFPLAEPSSPNQPPIPMYRLVSTISPYQVEIPLPDGLLRKGQNEIMFDLTHAGVHNIHLELDFPIASAPSYTQPSKVVSGAALPPIPPIGPEVQILKVGSTKVDLYHDAITDPNQYQIPVRGVIPIEIQATGNMMMEGMGANQGIAQVVVMVDRQVVANVNTGSGVAAPAVKQTIMLDTTQFPNGLRELFVLAYTPSCVPSIMDYPHGGIEPGRYFPIHINVKNPGAASRAEVASVSAAGPYQVFLPMVRSGLPPCTPSIPSSSLQGHSH